MPLPSDGPLALCGVLYDLRNDLGLAAGMGPSESEANVLKVAVLGAMSNTVWQATQEGDIVVLDRNFVQYGLIA